jgi:hypothetical protein
MKILTHNIIKPIYEKSTASIYSSGGNESFSPKIKEKARMLIITTSSPHSTGRASNSLNIKIVQLERKILNVHCLQIYVDNCFT